MICCGDAMGMGMPQVLSIFFHVKMSQIGVGVLWVYYGCNRRCNGPGCPLRMPRKK
jgi:hypothetical protein